MPFTSRHAVLAAATIGAGAALTPIASTGSAPAAVGPSTILDRAAVVDPVVEMAEHAHERAVHRHVKLSHINDRLKGERLERGVRREVSDWTTAHLRRANRRLDHRNDRLRKAARERAREAQATTAAPAAGGSTATPGNLQAIAACESGGNPGAVDASGTYRGKYQFDMQTWQSVGGSGDPAAAPEAEQDRRAAMLYSQSGSTPWPVCGR